MSKYDLTDEALLECCEAISKYLEEDTINSIIINRVNEVLLSYNWGVDYGFVRDSYFFKADLDGFDNFLHDKYRIKKIFIENETDFKVKSFYKMVIKDLKLNLLLDKNG